MGVWHSPNEQALSNIRIPLPCATQWRSWKAVIGNGGVTPLQNWASTEPIVAFDLCYSKNLTNACVCNLNANAPIAAGVIFRRVPMGIYQCQWYELMSTYVDMYMSHCLFGGRGFDSEKTCMCMPHCLVVSVLNQFRGKSLKKSRGHLVWCLCQENTGCLLFLLLFGFIMFQKNNFLQATCWDASWGKQRNIWFY